MDARRSLYYQEVADSRPSASNLTSLYDNTTQDVGNSRTQYSPSPTFERGSSRGREQDDPDLKRMRNTAASARFRAKKKRRELSLERVAREKREKLAVLEDRIAQLETENQWLKDLVMEKNEKRQRKNGVQEREGKVVDDVKAYEPKDGVGTGKKP